MIATNRAAQPAVGHVFQNYLGHSETFIYRTLTHHDRYRPIVACRSTENREAFPFATVYSSSRADLRPRPWLWCVDRAHRAVSGREWFLERALHREGVRVLHAHFGWEAPSFLSLQRRLGIPIIVSFYGAEFADAVKACAGRYADDGRWQTAYRQVFDAAAAVVVEGSHSAQRVRDAGCPDDKVHIVHIGVPPGAYRQAAAPSAGGALRVLCCGRLVDKKGVDDAVLAVRSARRMAPHTAWHLTIVGDGPLRPAIEDLVRREALGDTVTLVGRQSHATFIEMLQQTDVLLQPSRLAADGDDEGGAPTVLIEAQASGVPVVSTRHADIPEVVHEGRTGLLCAERDIDGLASALVRLAKDGALRARLGADGMRHVRTHYSSDTETAKLEAIYDAALE